MASIFTQVKVRPGIFKDFLTISKIFKQGRSAERKVFLYIPNRYLSLNSIRDILYVEKKMFNFKSLNTFIFLSSTSTFMAARKKNTSK